MAKYTNLTSLFTAIAEAIRAKKGTNDKIVADNFPEEIAAIEVGSSGNIGSEIETTRDRAIQISFFCDTTNLIGYVVLAETVGDVDEVAAIFYNGKTIQVFITSDADGNVGGLYEGDTVISHTISSNAVVIEMLNNYGVFYNSGKYYFYPIYSK